MCSPGCTMARIPVSWADMPLAVASAARPFSSAAMRSSSTATVGLLMRE